MYLLYPVSKNCSTSEKELPIKKQDPVSVWIKGNRDPAAQTVDA